jgi:hypothetical protein
VVCGEDVARKKPDPQVYVAVLAAMRLAPRDVLCLEDSPAGVAAARGAGCAVVVTRSACFDDAPIDGALAAGPGLHTRAGWSPPLPAGAGRVRLDDLAHWHAQAAERREAVAPR